MVEKGKQNNGNTMITALEISMTDGRNSKRNLNLIEFIIQSHKYSNEISTTHDSFIYLFYSPQNYLFYLQLLVGIASHL